MKPETQPLVAIIVISWNGLHDTLACLHSLRESTYCQRRVLLVDNASQDGTVDHVRRCFPEVEIIANESNLGYVDGNNQGIRWALDTGADWILLLNNDVILHHDALQEMVSVAESAPEIGVVGPVMQRTLRPDIRDLGGDLDFHWGRVLLRAYDPALNGQMVYDIDYVWGCALMAHRAIFEQTGGLNPLYVAYFEDAELCLQARTFGYKTVVALNAHITHAVGSSGEKRFAWQTGLRMRNHALFFLRFAQPRHWPALIPSLFLWQLPLIFLRSARVYLARKLRPHKYADRPITLWGYRPHA